MTYKGWYAIKPKQPTKIMIFEQKLISQKFCKNLSNPLTTEKMQHKVNFWVEYVITNPSTWAGCDTRSIAKQSLTGLKSVFLLRDWLL